MGGEDLAFVLGIGDALRRDAVGVPSSGLMRALRKACVTGPMFLVDELVLDGGLCGVVHAAFEFFGDEAEFVRGENHEGFAGAEVLDDLVAGGGDGVAPVFAGEGDGEVGVHADHLFEGVVKGADIAGVFAGVLVVELDLGAEECGGLGGGGDIGEDEDLFDDAVGGLVIVDGAGERGDVGVVGEAEDLFDLVEEVAGIAGAVVAGVVDVLHVGGVEGLLVVPDAVVEFAFEGHAPDVSPAAADVGVEGEIGVGEGGDGEGDVGMPDAGVAGVGVGGLGIDGIDIEGGDESGGGGFSGVLGADGVGVAGVVVDIGRADDRGADAGGGIVAFVFWRGEGDVGFVLRGELLALLFLDGCRGCRRGCAAGG